ncbi:uncharacterized protein LOC134531393 [Bacillus rossius redtenbacheri]|uniref:uncharacterized protein LOC134531393 n=1 Tax=Bacillus rossius redtenbacheri TaxID=93214 RepID=UPI002FDCF253
MGAEEGSGHPKHGGVQRVVKSTVVISRLPRAQLCLLSSRHFNHFGRRYGHFGGKLSYFGGRDLAVSRGLTRLGRARGGACGVPLGLPGGRAPHAGAASALCGGAKVLRKVGEAATVVAVAVDAYRLGRDAEADILEKGRLGKRTARTAASIGGGWAGGFSGAAAGRSTGAWVGGAVGSLFGGLCAARAALVGSALGAVLGSLGGVAAGSRAGEAAVDLVVADPDPHEDDALSDCEEDDTLVSCAGEEEDAYWYDEYLEPICEEYCTESCCRTC